MTDFGPRTTFKEGAEEVRAKLRGDISRLTRFRRGVSLKPSMGCIDCDATGKLPCISCDGSGRAKVLMGDEPEPCLTCDGKGYVTCTTCAGRGWVLNKNRKKLLWILGIGGLAWLFVFYRLWGGDVLPEQIANIKGGGGKAVRPPAPTGAVGNPGGSRIGPAGNVLAPSGGPLRAAPGAAPPPQSPAPVLPNSARPPAPR
jgi:hypothetical protein